MAPGEDGSPGASGSPGEPVRGSPVTRVELPVDTRATTGTTNAHLANGLLVDPAARTDALDEAVASHTPGVEAIAVTHAHPDHVGAVDEYADVTGAAVHAHADYVERFRDATGTEPDETFRDGDTLGTTGVRALDTPGHAPDHVAFVVGGHDGGVGDEDAAALVGDLVVAEGSVVVGAPEGDLRAYLASLERVRDAGFDRLYPGHGRTIDDPVAACERLIDHRLEREERVLAAVEAGADDVDAVLESAYNGDLTGVEDLARATVRAHLTKLVDENRIDAAWTDA